MGKSTISTAMFNRFLYMLTRGYHGLPVNSHEISMFFFRGDIPNRALSNQVTRCFGRRTQSPPRPGSSYPGKKPMVGLVQKTRRNGETWPWKNGEWFDYMKQWLFFTVKFDEIWPSCAGNVLEHLFVEGTWWSTMGFWGNLGLWRELLGLAKTRPTLHSTE